MPGVLSNLGNVLKDVDRLDEAIDAHTAALELESHNLQTRLNLAIALQENRQFETALAHVDLCLKAQPDNPHFRFERAQILLHLGWFAEGWVDYEARWETGDLPKLNADCPRWQGEPLDGQRLLLIAEQGYGDTIFASRYIPLVAERGAQITLACKPELHRLFQSLPIERMIDPAKANEHLPQNGQCHPSRGYDYHCPLMSLMGIFETDRDTIPPPAKLHVPTEARESFRFLEKDTSYKVGVVWSGSTTFKNNRKRAARLADLMPLTEVPNVQLYSLQKGPPLKELTETGAMPLIHDLSRFLGDFADTAAAVTAMDAIVMTDSSVAHLAGSLNVPVYNLLNQQPYWLYGLEGEGCPWYPSMTLLRQSVVGSWVDPMADISQRIITEESQRSTSSSVTGKQP